MQEYPDVGKEFKIITSYEESGKHYLILEDRSKWETADFKIGLWVENSIVSITLCGYKKFFSYYLKNLDENERVRSFFVGYEQR